jgi:uncharacterized cupin superfamily protein
MADVQNWAIWEKGVSKFEWDYEETETCYIIEGETKVYDKLGKYIQLKGGDMVKFEQGFECTWEITKNIKKRFKFD